MKPLTKKTALFLGRCLARSETAWRPIRANWTKGATIDAARIADAHGPWGGGGNAAAWKQAQRERDELREAGLLVDHTLTPEGKRLARSWVWPYSRQELTVAIDRVIECVERGDCRDGGLVPETFIAGHPWGGDTGPFADLQALLIPLLADGELTSDSTVRGQAFYAIAADDIEAAIAESIPGEIELRDDVCRAYNAEYLAAWQRILSDRTPHQNFVSLPIPVGVPVLSDRDYSDVSGIEPLFAEAAP